MTLNHKMRSLFSYWELIKNLLVRLWGWIIKWGLKSSNYRPVHHKDTFLKGKSDTDIPNHDDYSSVFLLRVSHTHSLNNNSSSIQQRKKWLCKKRVHRSLFLAFFCLFIYVTELNLSALCVVRCMCYMFNSSFYFILLLLLTKKCNKYSRMYYRFWKILLNIQRFLTFACCSFNFMTFLFAKEWMKVLKCNFRVNQFRRLEKIVVNEVIKKHFSMSLTS